MEKEFEPFNQGERKGLLVVVVVLNRTNERRFSRWWSHGI